MLAVRDVWVHPPGSAAATLHGVSFTLESGRWLAVTGPNGCGKSTLALALAGVWPVARGGIELGGIALAATAAGRAGLGVATVLQEPASQLFERTVRDEIAFTARNLGLGEPERSARVSEWSERLGLSALLDRDPQSLSAGWQQRVLIAAALASRPRLLIADEAMAHLDVASRAGILTLLRERVAQGLSMVWVTQDAGECAAADSVLDLSREAESSPLSGFRDTVLVDRGLPAGSEVWKVPGDPPPGSGGLRVRIAPRAAEASRLVLTGCPLEFEIAAARPIALVGPNGAGKTVALEAIAGFRSCPQVSVDARPTAAFTPVLAAQHPELQVFGESVAEELCFGVSQRGGSPDAALEIAAQLLVELGLGSTMLTRSTWELSSGERRLVQVISALVTPASAILIDEPTCGLDPARGRKLGQIIGRRAHSMPLLVATQDPGLVRLIGAIEVRLGGHA